MLIITRQSSFVYENFHFFMGFFVFCGSEKYTGGKKKDRIPFCPEIMTEERRSERENFNGTSHFSLVYFRYFSRAEKSACSISFFGGRKYGNSPFS